MKESEPKLSKQKVLKKRNATPELEKSESLEEESSKNASFICKECGDSFEHGQALGGHMSRKHPGQSQAFNKKIQRRKEREFER